MSTLEELREKLDQVDDQIVELYEQRSKLTEEVGEYKISNGIKVFDRQREHDKLQNVAAKVDVYQS